MFRVGCRAQGLGAKPCIALSNRNRGNSGFSIIVGVFLSITSMGCGLSGLFIRLWGQPYGFLLMLHSSLGLSLEGLRFRVSIQGGGLNPNP